MEYLLTGIGMVGIGWNHVNPHVHRAQNMYTVNGIYAIYIYILAIDTLVTGMLVTTCCSATSR